MKNFINLISIFIIILSSCKKETITPPEPFPSYTNIDTTGFLEIHIANSVNGLPLSLNTTTYVTSSNDTFSVDIFKYYISNIQLVSASGHTYTENNSYYLIDQSDANSLHLLVKKVPTSNIVSINFLIGVDSARNTSGAQTGALDPINDMFWSWNTGYIMAKMEGHSPQSSQPTKKVVYHIGGFSGRFNGIRNVSLPFPTTANITKTHTPILNLNADLYKWFTSPNFNNMYSSSAITNIGQDSKGIADNYASMFSVISVVN